MEEEGSGWAVIIVILLLAYFGGFFGGKDNSSETDYYDSYESYSPSVLSDSTSYEEEYEEEFDLSGSFTVEACNQESGSCYDLDADLDGYMVNTIYFPNGGHLDFDDGYCEELYCYGTDEEGTDWEFTVYY